MNLRITPFLLSLLCVFCCYQNANSQNAEDKSVASATNENATDEKAPITNTCFTASFESIPPSMAHNPWYTVSSDGQGHIYYFEEEPDNPRYPRSGVEDYAHRPEPTYGKSAETASSNFIRKAPFGVQSVGTLVNEDLFKWSKRHSKLKALGNKIIDGHSCRGWETSGQALLSPALGVDTKVVETYWFDQATGCLVQGDIVESFVNWVTLISPPNHWQMRLIKYEPVAMAPENFVIKKATAIHEHKMPTHADVMQRQNSRPTNLHMSPMMNRRPTPELVIDPSPVPGSVRPSPAVVKSQYPANFRDALTRRIKRAWFPPKGTMNTLRIEVDFKIDKEGQLSHLRLVSSSGVAMADKAALRAVENAAPFRGLPERENYDEVIPFTFDYQVFNPGMK